MSVQINVADHILLEDDYIMVLNKPCSLMVEPDRNGHPNLLQQVRKYIKTNHRGKEVYAQHIHRLDRPVSGIVLFAKKKIVLKNLSEQFAERKVKKYYQALTEHVPADEKRNIGKLAPERKKKAIIEHEALPEMKKILLEYEVENFSENRFLWHIKLHTGKYHQIRAQLSAAGYPIIGDALYNSLVPYKPDSIMLHACKLVFFHPVTGEEITVEQAPDWA